MFTIIAMNFVQEQLINTYKKNGDIIREVVCTKRAVIFARSQLPSSTFAGLK